MISFVIMSALFVCEAWLEQVVILLKNPSLTRYNSWNKAEHFRSAVFAGIIIITGVAYVTFIAHKYWLIPALILNRRIFFDFSLSLFRKRPLDKYEGTDWWAKKLSGIFRGNRVIELLVTVAITIFCIIKSL